jgi:hypothetical protein
MIRYKIYPSETRGVIIPTTFLRYLNISLSLGIVYTFSRYPGVIGRKYFSFRDYYTTYDKKKYNIIGTN